MLFAKSDGRARRGMVLGAVGAGILSLFLLFIELRPHGLPTHGVSVAGSLRTINTGAIAYYSRYDHGFPLRLSYLGGCVSAETNDQAACFIDPRLASGKMLGYGFYYVAGPVDGHGRVLSYTVHADPEDSRSKLPHYMTDQSGVIRMEAKRQADSNSPIIEEGP
jgi:hypothetical protein